MRKVLAVTMSAIMVLMSVAPVLAQDATQNQKPNMFGAEPNSGQLCVSAMMKGDFTFYAPKSFALHDMNLPDEKTTVAAPLPHNAAVLLLTTNKWQWVPQKGGDLYRFPLDSTTGKPQWEKPYARHDCGNPCKGVIYLPDEESQAPPVVQPPAPQPEVEKWQEKVRNLPPPTVTLVASKGKANQGEPVTLTWNSANADYCQLSWANTQATSGANSVTLRETTSFVVTAYGANGKTATATVTVTVKSHKLRNALLIAGGVILGIAILKNTGGHGGPGGHSFGHTGGVR